MILVDIGEFIFSSNAGITLPEADTVDSIVPIETLPNVRFFLETLLLNIEEIKITTTITPAIILPAFIMRLRLLRAISSFGIALSIVTVLLIHFTVYNYAKIVPRP